MKKLLLLTAALLALATACHRGRRMIISTKSNSVSIKIDCLGAITLNPDNTGIAGISPGGYMDYKRNDRELFAENNANGQVTYKLDDGTESPVLNNDEKTLLAEAIKILEKHR
jgi:hypothetical protein